MPTITLYVKDTDLKLVNEAKAKLADSLSAVFMDCVRQRLEDDVMKRITLTLWNLSGEPVLHRSFKGIWLVGDETNGIGAYGTGSLEWSVARTAKGRLVVYKQEGNGSMAPSLEIHDTFEAMKHAKGERGELLYPPDVISATAAALNLSDDELDI